MLSLGDAGIKMICDQVVPSGTGDDTRARFAIESLSRYLSKGNMENDRARWELICLDYIASKDDFTVKDFFMKQLQLAGSEKSIDALKGYLNNNNLCAPAVAVIGEVGGKKAETVLSEALKDRNLPCGVAVMNILAGMKSDMAIAEFIAWSNSTDKIVQGAAFNALAQSGNPQALSVLSKAARNVKYRWEHSGATESLLVYAGAAGEKGDNKSMEKVCKILIDNCNDRMNIQYKTGALEVLTRFKGADAMPYVISALGSQDKSYRNAALKYSLMIKDQKVTKQLIDFYPKARAEVKPEIIRNLGERKDNQAVTLVKSSLSDPDMAVRMESAPALVSLTGKESVNPLIEYLVKNNNQGDQEAARNTLVTVLDGKSVPMLVPALKDAGSLGKKSIIELLAWSNDKKYFADVVPFATSDDELVRGAAYKAFSSLASPSDQDKLIELLSKTDNPSYTGDLQVAIASAANQVGDPEERSSRILNALSTFPQKEKLIPVLALTGGREALSTVLKEFENGSVEMRTVCFKALTSWKDFSASSALYAICSSGNKNYGTPAFDGYVRQVRTARVTDDQRLLLYRKMH